MEKKGELGQTIIAFVSQGTKMQHKICLYTYYGVHKDWKADSLDHHHQAIPESLLQFQDNLLLVSSIAGLEIFDIKTLTSVRLISFNKSFQMMIRVNPAGYDFESQLIEKGIACIGLSYKNFFAFGTSLTNDPRVAELQKHPEWARQANSRAQERLFNPGDIACCTQVEKTDSQGRYTNHLYYSLREEDGIIHKIKLEMERLGDAKREVNYQRTTLLTRSYNKT